ncbi:MAG: hypothetical protein RBG13Loki_0372 [Promethearchaeota archaeon CR_4]|nr:MAG: hypothetical protein RBG13Loki_0372 [Candidatus Lokiarchaeota archaeon CR_4]
MFNITRNAGFEGAFNPDDPLNKLPERINEAITRTLAVQIDDFIRAAIRTAVPDETVALFANDNKALPGLDLDMELLSYCKRRMTVKFRGQELGHATFETKIVKQADLRGMNLKAAILAQGGANPQSAIVHEVTDVWIRS